MSAKNIHVLRKYQDERYELVSQWLKEINDVELNWVKDPSSPQEELKSVLSRDYTATSCENLREHIWEHMDTKPFLVEAYESEPDWPQIKSQFIFNGSIFDD
tara:strand:- start:291 stop:596 length:306 start_codon:yes stop_codon:yes gene_type:complete